MKVGRLPIKTVRYKIVNKSTQNYLEIREKKARNQHIAHIQYIANQLFTCKAISIYT